MGLLTGRGSKDAGETTGAAPNADVEDPGTLENGEAAEEKVAKGCGWFRGSGDVWYTG